MPQTHFVPWTTITVKEDIGNGGHEKREHRKSRYAVYANMDILEVDSNLSVTRKNSKQV